MYNNIYKSETIYAQATIAGKSGVAVIRISGAKSFDALKNLTKKDLPDMRYMVFGKLYNKQDEIIDHAMYVCFKAPHSFTGEDVVELHVHGSRAVINAVMQNLSEMQDLRMAEAGEFAKRSFLNGKMDLTQAEGLADLIDAETEIQAKQALRQMGGQLEKLYDGWRHSIVENLAFTEAFIDFPEEEIPQDIIQEINNKINEVKSQISAHLSDNNIGEKIRDGIKIAIIGAPNVGKSSLLNCLAKRDVAIVSNIAGTTRDIVEVHLNIKGIQVIIADTAGLRESQDLIEKEGIIRAKDRAKESDLILALFDASMLPEMDLETKNLVTDNSIVIFNKIDKATDIMPNNSIGISVKENINIDNLIVRISDFVSSIISDSSDPVITRERYRIALSNSLIALNEFSLAKPIELAAEDLRHAAFHIGTITGHVDVESLLGIIFSNFCIGK
jgi:tRNA modification GTPase